MDEIKKTIKTMSEEVKKYYKQLKKVHTELDMHEVEQTGKILAIDGLFEVTEDGSRETSSIENQDTSDKTMQNDIEEDTQIKKLREMASIELKKYSAKSLTELEPNTNAHVEFEIKLIDPNMKPIRPK